MERELTLLRCATGVSLAIGLLVVLNRLQIPFYLYYPRATHTVLISESYDLYFFLVSSVCLPVTVLQRKLSKAELIGILTIWGVALILTVLGQPYSVLILYATVVFAVILNVSNADLRRVAVTEILACTLPIFVLIESSPLYYWFSASLNPQAQTGLLYEQLELNLTYSFFSVAIIMMILLLFSWIPLVFRARLQHRHLIVRYQPTRRWNLRLFLAAVDLFAIVALVVFFYSYLAGQTWIVGVDSYWRYLNPLNDFAGLAPSKVIATSATHGVYVAFLYLIQVLTGASSFSIVKFAPLVLAFATASSVFWMIKCGGWNFELAFLSSLCTLLWLPTTLGIYGGLQANWVAFLLWMFFLSFYFRSTNWSAITFVTQALISLGILMIHPWTWGVFLGTLLMTVLVSWRTPLKSRCVQGALASLIIALPVATGLYEVIPSLGIDWANTIGVYTLPLIHPASILLFGNAMIELFLDWSSFLPPILLLICLVGVYGLFKQDGVMRNYLVGWIIVWCIGSILIAPSGFNTANPWMSESALWRMLYVSPLPILLAVGVEKVLEVSRRLEVPGSGASRMSYLIPAALVAASGVLSLSASLVVRLLVVAVTVVGFTVLLIRFPKYLAIRVLVASLLILVLVNAAFRSLYPLLLDPHNLLGPIST